MSTLALVLTIAPADYAKALDVALGYGDYQLDPAAGHALFWQKKL